MNLVDASGNVVASYSYDTWGNLTSASENFGSGVTWTNPYRYDGRDGVRYDEEAGHLGVCAQPGKPLVTQARPCSARQAALRRYACNVLLSALFLISAGWLRRCRTCSGIRATTT